MYYHFSDPQFGFNQSSYTFVESGSLEQTTIIVTNGVMFQTGVTRRVRVNTADGTALGKSEGQLPCVCWLTQSNCMPLPPTFLS